MDDLEIEDIDLSIKIIVVGNAQVGKTTLAIRFVKDVFTAQYKKTLGVDFLSTKRLLKSNYTIWDTAGQEQYDAITRRYYRGADACLIVFSIADRNSFDCVQKWFDKVKSECSNILIYLVMSKIDLVDSATVTEQEGQNLANQLGIKFMKTSSKTGTQIKELFESLASEHFKNGKNSNANEMVDNIAKGNKPNKSNEDDIKEIKSDFAKPKAEKQNKEPSFRLNGESREGIVDDNKKVKKKKKCCK